MRWDDMRGNAGKQCCIGTTHASLELVRKDVYQQAPTDDMRTSYKFSPTPGVPCDNSQTPVLSTGVWVS